MKVQIRRVRAPLRAPWQTSRGAIRARDLLLLRLERPDGQAGLGEAAPLAAYDGASIEDVQAALEDCRPLLAAADGHDQAELLSSCARRAALPQALAAIDLALWDLAGRWTGEPVWRLLGAAGSRRVEVNYTISSADRAGAAQQAARAREEGFACLKVKVGIGDDAGRLAAIRAAAGPAMAIRIDANGAWSLTEAKMALRALEPVGIELCEEPVRGLGEMARLSEITSIPLALDEGGAAPGALQRRVCTAVCLKIARCGGISHLLRAAEMARAVGYEVYLASTLDGPLGIAAALHAAAVLAPDRPCGLATLGLFDGRPDPLPPAGGAIELPAARGLGDDGLAAWYGEPVDA